MELEQVGFKQTESRDTFAQRLLAFRDGVIVEPQVGYITSEIWREGETCFSLDHGVADMHDCSGSTLYISSMVVHPSQRGKRLGESYVLRLIAQVTAKYASVRRVLLIVNTCWTAAAAIYTRLGFVETQRVPNFFTDGDAVVMKKEL